MISLVNVAFWLQKKYFVSVMVPRDRVSPFVAGGFMEGGKSVPEVR
jgi:hypothetical protein